MGNLLSPTHLIVILLIILVLFGRGKISDFMGDFAKGIKSFKKGMKEDEDEVAETQEKPVIKTIEAQVSEPAPVKRKAAPRKAASASKASKSTKTVARKTTKTKS